MRPNENSSPDEAGEPIADPEDEALAAASTETPDDAADEDESEDEDLDDEDDGDDDLDSDDEDESDDDEPEEDDGRLHDEALARRIADVCWEKKAEDIVVIDMSDALGVFDYFVIASATAPRHARMIAEACEEAVKEFDGYRMAPMEGASEGQWICADFGDVVLHVFVEETRRYYDLEHTWGDAPRLDWEPPKGGKQDVGALEDDSFDF